MPSTFAGTATEFKSTPIPPAGSFGAVLVALVDLGTHSERFRNKDQKTGKVKETVKDVRELLIVWELPEEKVEGFKDLNHLVFKRYSVTFSEKSGLRIMMETWRSKKYQPNEDIDPAVLLGKSCQVNVTHRQDGDRTYANFTGVSPLGKGMKVAKPQNTPVIVGLDDKLPAWIPTHLYGEKVEDIRRFCLEHGGQRTPPQTANGQPNGTDSDEIPF